VAETTVGQRVYLVRLALGDGVRKALPMREFSELLSSHDDAFHASRISDIENDKSAPSLEEVRRIAAVDPLRRGKVWLAGWDDEWEGDQGAHPNPPQPTEPPIPRAVTVQRKREILAPLERVTETEKPPRKKPNRTAMAG